MRKAMAVRGYRYSSKKSQKVPDNVWTDPWYFIGFGLGSGAMPIAPGTFGTLFAIPIYLMLSHLPLSYYLTVVAFLFLFSIWLCEKLSREIRVHDHPGMCIDEFIGYFITMIAAPPGWIWIVIGFVLFRIFDILKPFPISWIDKNIHGGVGMILDDAVAGLVSFIVIQFLAFLLL